MAAAPPAARLPCGAPLKSGLFPPFSPPLAMRRTPDNAAKRKNTMDMQYQLKAGSYYLYDMRDTPSVVTGERRFRLKTDTVAIAFDAAHRRGAPAWQPHAHPVLANNTRRRLRAAGAQDIANDIVVVSARCPWMN